MPDPTTGPVTPAQVHPPLLTLITQQSLDEDYRHVAEQRAAGGEAPPRLRAVGTATAVVAVFGLLATVAALQTSERSGVQSASRASLISNIDARRDQVAKLQGRIVDVREVNVRLQTRLADVTAEERAAVARNTRIAVVAGFAAVTGPGVRVVVDDGDGGNLVADRDLRPLVDGLWLAGAEAIAINGQRLTARSAIRNSGLTIRITGNNRSLSPQYVVEAIGNRDTLQADLMETTGGLIFRDTAAAKGFDWDMDNVEELSLPAAPPRLLRLRSAQEGSAEQSRNQRTQEATE
jgi:uncharacterized protein YlxW (UPF0749 family)